MRLIYSKQFLRAYGKAPKNIQQALLLGKNLRHPSLRAKKFDEGKDQWQARVTESWRFYFTIEGDAFVITDVIPHPK